MDFRNFSDKWDKWGIFWEDVMLFELVLVVILLVNNFYWY